jgi:hypothetical protein
MSHKKLYYIVSYHGGVAGTHTLTTGNLREGEILLLGSTFVYRVLTTFVGDPGVQLELGTIAEPSLPPYAAVFDPYSLVVGPPQFGNWAPNIQYATMTSPWAITVVGGDLTDGVLELDFERIQM